jgi:hypothetical protein
MTHRSPVWLVLALLLPQCGGGAGGAEPKTTTAGDAADSEASSEGSKPEADDADDTSAAAEKPGGPNCDDGTCSMCGPGICPAGWYCDESAPGGAACAWLKECADKATCGCVTKVLGSACKCRDDGGIKVSCN